MNMAEFLNWERASYDTMDIKRLYIDAAGDLSAGIMLSQIIYWSLPNRDGKTKLRVQQEGFYWLAKTRADWWDECRITPRQVDRLLPILEEQHLIETRIWKFDGKPTTHIRILWEVLLPLLDDILINPPVNPYKANSESPNGENDIPESLFPFPQTVISKSPNGENDITKRGVPITENTTKNTTETTSRKPPSEAASSSPPPAKKSKAKPRPRSDGQPIDPRVHPTLRAINEIHPIPTHEGQWGIEGKYLRAIFDMDIRPQADEILTTFGDWVRAGKWDKQTYGVSLSYFRKVVGGLILDLRAGKRPQNAPPASMFDNYEEDLARELANPNPFIREI